jgi:hypothetical protein
MIRKILVAALLAASFGSIATSAGAEIIVRVAPPQPRMEVAPQPRRGYVWVAGHWEWKNRQHKHQWVAGTWVRERRGHHYNQPTWVERDGGWSMERGGWQRGDADRDGVPNNQDRSPNNPNRS